MLSSLSEARLKGSDAAIKQSINNMRGEAELFYNINFSYSAMCDHSVILNALNRANELNGAGVVTCVDGDDVPRFWAIESQLISSSTQYYCIDNDGKALITNESTISNISGSEDAVCG